MNTLAWRTCTLLCLCCATVVLFFACRKPPRSTLFATLGPADTGIDFSNDLPDEDASDDMNIVHYLYYYNGGGVAAGDLNNDGLPDLYFTANRGGNKLYINKGGFKFEDATERAGAGGTGSWKTGVSLADVNADGWLDIYICQVGRYKSFEGKNQLLINNRDGTFTDKAAEYGLDLSAFCTQAVFFDYDLDGDLDCFVLCHSVHSPESYKDTSISRQYDRLSSDRLFRNDGGVFTDVTAASGLHDGKSGYGLGVVAGDVNGDGYPDLYVSNDFHENDFLYYNIEGKYFREAIAASTGHSSNFSMGCELADVNNDALPDVVTLDMKPEDELTLKASQPADQYQVYEFKHSFGYHWQSPRNCLQLNRGPAPSGDPVEHVTLFSEVGQLAGIDATDWSWSPLLADFDLDGRKDLFISNGIPHRPNDNDYLRYISSNEVQRNASDRALIEKMPSGEVKNYCFRNGPDLRFQNVSAAWGLDWKGCSNGAVFADLDNDGDPDLVTNNLNAPAGVFRNDISGAGFLRIRLKGAGANTFGIGVRVQVFAKNEVQYFENQPVRGFQSCMEPGLLLVGLGDAPSADSIRVIWPGGTSETLKNVAARQTLTFDALHATARASVLIAPATERLPLLDTWVFGPSAPLAADLEREKLMPWSVTAQGPEVYVTDLNGDGLDDICRFDTAWLARPDGRFLPASPPALPKQFMPQAPACIRIADYDGDGDQDVFIGARCVPGAYGETPRSFLLQNNGHGNYLDVTDMLPGGHNQGMVTDAQWADMDRDGRPDLVVCGEWMPLLVFRNTPTGFKKTEIPHATGLWNCLHIADYDGDGDPDIAAGNLGLNSNLRASASEPLGLWVKDFDGNGSVDPVLTYYRQERNYVFADKDVLVNQLPVLKKRFVEYRKYAESDFDVVFPPQLREGALSLKAETLASCIVVNEGNDRWTLRPLPLQAQFSPVFAITSGDFDGDGHADLLLGGNYYEVQPAIGRFDASYGTFLRGDGTGQYHPVPLSESPFWLPGPVRSIERLNGPGGRKRLMVARNDGSIQVYELPGRAGRKVPQ
ncbi:MAG: VCBS repeat-containing protein [Lewinellaceae bacterium]|nr:VCBS repeat-containing protein [Lewinellaceae bacterium]